MFKKLYEKAKTISSHRSLNIISKGFELESGHFYRFVIKRKRYLRDSRVIFLRVRMDKRDCDLDVELRLTLGAEAQG